MKLPQAWTEIRATKVEEPKTVTAKIDMGAEVVGRGLCPECRQPMEEAYVDGLKVWSCVRDRVALPQPNDEEENEVEAPNT